MTVTRQQAFSEDEFHYGECRRDIGPKGGVTIKQVRVRRNGMTKTWVTRPTEFSVPFKYGMREYGYITHMNANAFHAACDCPLNDPTYVTSDARVASAS